MIKDRKKKKDSEKPGRTQFIMMFFAFSFGMILSNLIAQSSAQKNAPQKAPLFIYKGIDKTLEDISHEFKDQILALEEKKLQALELAAIQIHVYQYAQDNGMNIEEASEAIFPASERQVDTEQVSQFYNENRESIGKPFYQVESEIKERLRYQRVAKLKEDLLVSLKESGDLAILSVY